MRLPPFFSFLGFKPGLPTGEVGSEPPNTDPARDPPGELPAVEMNEPTRLMRTAAAAAAARAPPSVLS